jgi:hypothetical protein
MADISNLLKSAGINAEQTATTIFGQAVQDFAGNPIASAIGNIGNSSTKVNRNDGTWHATSYAASAVNSQFRGKFKFLFRVEFLFKQTPDVQHFLTANKIDRNFVFMVKQVDRPKVDFEYEEVNMYNQKTRVLKSIKHKELNLTFIDDVGNNVYEFFRFMMMVHSPITRRSANAGFNISEAYAAYTSGNGMVFTDSIASANVAQDFASRGVINTDVGNIIQAIKISQVFVNPAQTGLGNAVKEVAFFFINPRVVSFDLDEMSHDSSDMNVFTMSFDYDFMAMTPARNMQAIDDAKKMPTWKDAPGDLAPSSNTGASSGNANPYTQLISNSAARAAQKIVSSTVGRYVKQVPGLGIVADTLSGKVEQITRASVGNLASSTVSSISQAFARPSRALVTDDTTQQNANALQATYTSSTGTYGTDQPSIEES